MYLTQLNTAIDRLFLSQEYQQTRSLNEKEKSLKELHKLLDASAGIFLGYDVKEQKKYLATTKAERGNVEVTIELWFSEQIFSFIGGK